MGQSLLDVGRGMTRAAALTAAAAVMLLITCCSTTTPEGATTAVYRSTAPPITFAQPSTAPTQPAGQPPSMSTADHASTPTPAAATLSAGVATGLLVTSESDPPVMQTTDLPDITPMTQPLTSAADTAAASGDHRDPVRTAAGFATRYWTRNADDSQTDNWATRAAPFCTAQLGQQLAADQLGTPGRPVSGTQTATILQAAPRPYPAPTLDRVTITMRVELNQSTSQDDHPAVATVTTFNVTMQRQKSGTWAAAALLNQAN